MTYNVNPKKLRKELIGIYSDYISNDLAKRDSAKKVAAKVDGAWTGAFLLDRDVEVAIGGLV